jgi:hypothetical protein
MHHHSLTTLLLLAVGALSLTTPQRSQPSLERPCGFKIAPCPSGQICKKTDPTCDRGENCAGICVPAPVFCGGIAGIPCREKGQICVDDPTDDCDPANGGADCAGMCVTEPEGGFKFCGGIAGFPCREKGKVCVDDPRDDCDPAKGGADCGGICV